VRPRRLRSRRRRRPETRGISRRQKRRSFLKTLSARRVSNIFIT
jgi:hypothetical protein